LFASFLISANMIVSYLTPHRSSGRRTIPPSSFAQQLRQLGDVAGNPSRLVFSEQLGCHASLIFGVWLICTIQGPKDFSGDPRDPKIDPIDWIERIPISETRNYVQRVFENMQVYRALVENNPKLLIEADLRRGG
jgi:hypothetical protein